MLERWADMTTATLKPRQALRCLQATMSTREWNADTADWVMTLLTQAGYGKIELADDQYICVVRDVYYEPDGDYDVEEERAKLATGEYGAYVVILQRLCDCGNFTEIGSLSGIVVEGDYHEATYSTLDSISDGYLREVAVDLMLEHGEV
jgi:hypothetical protein